MPRDGSGVASPVAGANTASSGTVIQSTLNNSNVNDIYQLFNTAWPVSLGGTGGTTLIGSWDSIAAAEDTVASAATLVLTGLTKPFFNISGTTGVTAITQTANTVRIGRVASAGLTFTASATLLINGLTSNSYTSNANDLVMFEGYAASTVRMWVLGRDTTLSGYTTTVTAAGTTTLTAASNNYQYFTGVTTQTITMPVTSTLALGRTWTFVNNSTGALTINSSGGNLITTVAAGSTVMVQCILLTGTSAASWNVLSAGGGIGAFANGTAAAPSITFASDPDTGWYRIGANNIGGAVNGAKVLDVSATGLGVVGTILDGNGTVGNPAYSFTSDPTTGFYRIGANNVGLALGGAKAWDFSATALVPGVDGTQVLGSAAKQMGYFYLADSAQLRWKDAYYITVAGTAMSFNAAASYYFDGLINLDPAGATGGRIQFPATQNASANVNTLDDYEEGTFTPTMTFNASSTGVTYSVQNGFYVKVGQLVYVYGRITLTSNGSGVGTARITGLPFTSQNVSATSVGKIRLITGGSAATGIYPYVEINSASALLQIPGAASDAQATDTNVTDTFSCDFSITYQASA